MTAGHTEYHWDWASAGRTCMVRALRQMSRWELLTSRPRLHLGLCKQLPQGARRVIPPAVRLWVLHTLCKK